MTSLAGGSILFSLFALNQWDVTSPNLLSPTGGRNKPTIPTSGDSKIKMKASELAEVGIKVTPGGKDDGFLAIEKVDTPAEKKEKEEQAKKEEEEKKAREAEEKGSTRLRQSPEPLIIHLPSCMTYLTLFLSRKQERKTLR